jgi:hypothetical protein
VEQWSVFRKEIFEEEHRQKGAVSPAGKVSGADHYN